jgi:hypothetical protein
VAAIVTPLGSRKTLNAIDWAMVGKVQQSVADYLAPAVEAKQHVALNEIPLDPDQDCGIVLLALFRIFGDEELASVFAKDARLAIAQAENSDADAARAAISRTDLDPHHHITLQLDIVPRAEEIRRLAI